MTETQAKGDFSKGSIPRVITGMALPLMAAQLVNVLYNIVDRIYIGNIPGYGSLALAGLGVAAPVILAISAFTGLFGVGGVPLFSIARGRGDEDEAGRIMGTSFSLLMICAVVLMAAAWALLKPSMLLFGATEDILPFAVEYLAVYIVGTPFVMASIGMNGYINAQGFPKRGMLTVLMGAAANIVLDPLFIYTLNMGVRGAAWATVISQAISAVWCLSFLTGKKAELPLPRRFVAPTWKMTGRIAALGVTNFIVAFTNSLIQVLTNRQLGFYGGELHLSAIVIINSLRSVFIEVTHGFSAGMQPVLGYNYGAGEKARVLHCIRFTTLATVGISAVVWLLFELLPQFFLRLFTPDAELIALAVPAVRIYFCGISFMALQAIGQSTHVGLGEAKKSIFFSLLRKVFIVTPLVLLLPKTGLGAWGVYWSEPISDLLGGGACFITMMLTVYRPIRLELKKEATA